MFYVVLAILAITSINVLMRYTTVKSRTVWGVMALNYLTGAIVSVILYISGGSPPPGQITIMLAVAAGLLYVSGMSLNMKTMSLRGASITASVVQLSVLIPVGLSILLYGEHLRVSQVAGVCLAVVSLPLLAFRPGVDLRKLDGEAIPYMLATLVVIGFAQLTSKVFISSGLGMERDGFFAVIFTFASLITIPIALRHRGEITRVDLPLGVGVGAFNILGNMFILEALKTLPGAVVFPLNGSGALVLVTAASMILFKEKVSRLNAAGMLVTLVAVVLINI
jgi:drug/metabolite transporter (DMT)-like permease